MYITPFILCNSTISY